VTTHPPARDHYREDATLEEIMTSHSAALEERATGQLELFNRDDFSDTWKTGLDTYQEPVT
jgi:hypothetical protein